MNDHTTASQAAAQILSFLGITHDVSMEPGADRRRDQIQALIESAFPSKLRAPVADERSEWQEFSDWASKKEGPAVGQMEGQAAVWAGWQERARRAALASAPL